MTDRFPMLIWLVCLLLCAVISLSNLQINLTLCVILNCYSTEHLVLQRIFCMHGQPIIFHLILCFFYLLYCNVTSKTSTKIIQVPLYLLVVKWNFDSTLRNNSLAKTWPTGPSALALTTLGSMAFKTKIVNEKGVGIEHCYKNKKKVVVWNDIATT